MNFQKWRSHLKILGFRILLWSNSCTYAPHTCIRSYHTKSVMVTWHLWDLCTPMYFILCTWEFCLVFCWQIFHDCLPASLLYCVICHNLCTVCVGDPRWPEGLLHCRGPHVFQKCRSHLKIEGARGVAWHKSCTEDPPPCKIQLAGECDTQCSCTHTLLYLTMSRGDRKSEILALKNEQNSTNFG